MACHKAYNEKGVQIESWVGRDSDSRDCAVKDWSCHFLRVKSHRGDRGKLTFTGSSGYSGNPKQLHFTQGGGQDRPTWQLHSKDITPFGGFTEWARLIIKHRRTATDTVVATIDECDYMPDFRITNTALYLDVDL
jgi:hypothetical protein